MNYQKHYNLLINRARNRLLEGYVEKHHIIPKCMGGSNESENLVKLTPEEHFVAHQLLVKLYPENKKLIFAAHSMANMGIHRNNKEYGWLKKKRAQVLSETMTGKNHPLYGKSGTMTGKKHTPEALKKMKTPRLNKQNMKQPTGSNSPNFGRKMSEETKQKLRKSKPEGFAIGKSNSMYGKTHKIEAKLKMREKALNRKRGECPHCGVIMMISHLKQHHFDNCKYKKGEL